MKIAIMGSIANPNVGDEAILLATLRNIEKIASKNDEVYILTKDCSYTTLLCKQFKFQIISIDILHRYVWRFPFTVEALSKACDEMVNSSPSLEEYSFELRSIHDIFKSIDVLHIIGGGYINSYWLDILYEVKICVNLAHKYKKRIVFTGQTIGPIKNDNSQVLMDMFNKAHVIDMRDDNLYGFINTSKAKKKQVTLDDAILFDNKSTYKNDILEGINNKEYINICIQDWKNYTEIISKKLETEIADYLNYLLERKNIAINFLEFNHFDHDMDMAKKILENIKEENQGRCKIINLSQFSPELTQYILSHAMFNMGTRFHMAVFSLYASVPILSIYTDEYYKIKIKGIHDLFNSMSYVEINDVTKEVLLNFESRIDLNRKLLKLNRKNIVKKYNEKMKWISRMYGNTKLRKIINYILLRRYL